MDRAPPNPKKVNNKDHYIAAAESIAIAKSQLKYSQLSSSLEDRLNKAINEHTQFLIIK